MLWQHCKQVLVQEMPPVLQQAKRGCLLRTSDQPDENAGYRRRSRHRLSCLDLGVTFNPSKALSALVGLVCMTVLIGVKAIDQDQGLPIITMIVGYSIGNGITAMRNQQMEPIIKRKDTK